MHRYCKRITSRATGNLTSLIRIITGCLQSYEKLLNEGVFYKNKHYAVYPSSPPPPLPIPCAKCMEFTHTTENCGNPIKCSKCFGQHYTNNCTSTLAAKCTSCQSEEHMAWSPKCPKRPTAPITGIPNAKIKSINKLSAEIDSNITNNNRVHKAITIHDHIITTYVNKLNKNGNNDRQHLIDKLKKRFINNYRIDTAIVFSGNSIYIFMFDLDRYSQLQLSNSTY